MTVHRERISVLHGDCLSVMAKLPDASFDACVTDPPYGLSKEPDIAEVLTHWLAGDDYTHTGGGFMGKSWDSFVPGPATWREVHRIMKPGGHLLCFAGTRTQDLMGIALRLAGFEIRDQIGWLYGSGFPKSHDVSKAIDRKAGVEREILQERTLNNNRFATSGTGIEQEQYRKFEGNASLTAPATAEAAQWEGWGTALKPAQEPIIVARKPLIGTVAANVLAHGTGALNIDACRIGTDKIKSHHTAMLAHGGENSRPWHRNHEPTTHENVGRWPANVLHDGSAEVMEAFAAYGDKGGGHDPRLSKGCPFGGDNVNEHAERHWRDSGSAARFFYSAKADSDDRAWSKHPTIKPLALMRYLVRLVTQPGGHIIEPFAGTGTTGEAAMLEGFWCTMIEREAEYIADIEKRLGRQTGDDMPLFAKTAVPEPASLFED